MSLWRILVLGLLRQVISADYDRVCNLAQPQSLGGLDKEHR